MHWRTSVGRRLYEMSSDERLLEAYRTFPKNLNYLDALENAINQGFTEEHLSAVKKFWISEGTSSMTLSLYAHPVGTYAVEYARKEYGGYGYHVSFTPADWYLDKHDDRTIEWRKDMEETEQTEFLNSVVIPFVNSMGMHKDEMPLVISIFPELVSYAMENDFDEEEEEQYEDEWGDDDEDDT